MIIQSLTDRLSVLGWEKNVDIIWVNGRIEVLVAICHGGASCPELPSIDFESCKIRVGRDCRELPGDVSIIGAWVGSQPVEGASIARTVSFRRFQSKAEGNGWPRRLAAKNSADNADVEIVCGPTRSQAKQARDIAAVH